MSLWTSRERIRLCCKWFCGGNGNGTKRWDKLHIIYYTRIFFLQEIKHVCTIPFHTPLLKTWLWCPSARCIRCSPKHGTAFSHVRLCAFVLSVWYHFRQSRKAETETYRGIRHDDPKKTILIEIKCYSLDLNAVGISLKKEILDFMILDYDNLDLI